jgi:RHS repeat-associated protein
MGDVPVATLRPNGSTVSIYYVHTDHLNAPRIVTQSSADNSARWLWGGNAPNQNPVGLGTFVYNLRFPGQYYQVETGLFYNYFRDYDPAVGRYVESDPIGLGGGNYSTYGYADENPVSGIDPMGLWVKICARWTGKSTNSATSRLNPTRHDYLNVSGQFIGFYSAPGANPAWGRGIVAGQDEQDGGRCSPLCNDDKFDAYVLAAAKEIGPPTYCAIASAEFGLSGLAAEAAGARNCQSWARDVLAKAKQNYLAHENCPMCFRK